MKDRGSNHQNSSSLSQLQRVTCFRNTPEDIEKWRQERRKNYPSFSSKPPSKVIEKACQRQPQAKKPSQALIVKLLERQVEDDAFHLLQIFRFISDNSPHLLN